ncbi:MAG TPA: hypothetical protein PJ988_00595 [Anaerolinea sp.]|nr:hypothetical protein [Anaerolinea sp.]
MLRKLVWGVVVFGLLALAACSPNANTATSANQMTSHTLTTDYTNALSVEMQLAYGTLKLKDSANEIDSQTAADLLPLWKAVRSLSDTDGTAQAEIQAVYRQIEESMPAEQLQAIADMQLTSADVREVMAQAGLGADRASASSSTSSAQAAPPVDIGSGMAIGGDMGGGAPPADMGGGMPGGAPAASGSTSGTNTTSSSATSAAATNPIVDLVIAYLQSKIV